MPVKVAVRRFKLARRLRKIDIPELLRVASIVVLLLMAIVFLCGCEAPKAVESDSNSVMQKTDTGHEVHGEVGAMYGERAR